MDADADPERRHVSEQVTDLEEIGPDLAQWEPSHTVGLWECDVTMTPLMHLVRLLFSSVWFVQKVVAQGQEEDWSQEEDRAQDHCVRVRVEG